MSPYPAAVGMAISSIFVILLVIPPMWWHCQNRNVGATSVIVWIIIMNLNIFVNAVIWPDDNFSGYKGQGLCDVEVKLQVASQVAFPASFACVLRALAAVMDTERMTVTKTKSQKRRDLGIDLLWCFGFPSLSMIFHYVVQPYRYYLFGISGCVPAVSNDWVTVVLILVPPVIWVVVCAIYAVIILVRLHRYRRSFQLLLMNNGTNQSRFLRLLLLCILWIFANVPVQCYVFSVSFSVPRESYEWADVHRPEQWATLLTIPSRGTVLYDRYIWLANGIVMFLFFGFGTEALRMYRTGIRALRLTSLMPCCFTEQRKSMNDTNSRKHMLGQNRASSVVTTSDYTVSLDTPLTRIVAIDLSELEKGT